MLTAFVSAFRSPARVIAAILIAFLTLAAATLLPNTGLLRIVLTDSSIPTSRALQIAISLMGSLATNFTPLATAYTVPAALLVGINAVLAFYLLRRARGIGGRAAASGFGGIVAGVFGLGCAACGSVLLSVAAGTVAGAGLIPLLPFGGQEFGVIGVILLAASTYALLRRIGEPLACPVVPAAS